jgi:hypothetical protein
MLHLFTYGAGDISRFEHLKSSADFCCMQINYITQTKWNGFFDKIKYTLNAIKNLPDNDMVCFMDGFDVLAVGSHHEIKMKFLTYDCDILFGAELNCWPGEYASRFPKLDIKNGYKFLNSGGFIGYKKAVMDLYNWKTLEEVAHICKTCGGDQGYFIEYFIANYNTKRLKLDSEVKIFQNMFSVDWNEIYISEGRVVNSVIGSTPCFFHFNGGSWEIAKGGNIMPVFVDTLFKSVDNPDKVYTLESYKQNFNAWYFKRSQL